MQAELRRQDIVEPTPVQAAAIPKVLQGGNVAVQCYTGSGKVCGPRHSLQTTRELGLIRREARGRLLGLRLLHE